MSHTFYYVGCFLNPAALHNVIRSFRKNPLDREIPHPHITFSYMPEEVNLALFGKRIPVTILGYGNNGVNEGLLVSLHSKEPELQTMIDQIEIPHITLSVCRDGRSMNTKHLTFECISPIRMTGRFGGFILPDRVMVKGRYRPRF